jgi:hypothetical protein
MARFIYHSRLPGVAVPLIGIPAMIGFCVLVIHSRIADPYLIWIFIAFFVALAIVVTALYGLLDKATRRVQNVGSYKSGEGRIKKLLGARKRRELSSNEAIGHFEWEIGPRGAGLLPHWIGTLCLLGLAAAIIASQFAVPRPSRQPESGGWLAFSLLCVFASILIWMTVVRFRVDGQVVRIERPFALFGQAESFSLTEIKQVDVSHMPHDRRWGKCLKITLEGGRQIRFSESDRIIGKIAQNLQLAIERSHEAPHPLSDDAVR